MVESVGLLSFWTALGLTVYAYLGYPVLLALAALLFKKPVRKKPILPRVSVVISAFNEEKTIEQKILNLLDSDYPEEQFELLVGSDGASDRTDEIVSKFHSTRVRLFRFIQNMGKPSVLSALVSEASGDIIVFTDARQEFDREAIRELVSNFSDPEVGCVSGELCFRLSGGESGSVAGGMDAYWRYEKFLRKKEGEIGSMLGATGAIYAIRKELFPKHLPADTLVDDMYIPFEAIRRGYRAVFESKAKAYDRVSEKGEEELKRKVRTLAGNYQVFCSFPDLFIPFKSPIAWQLFSHKFLRLLVPFFLVVAFLSNLILTGNPFYLFLFMVQCLFYGLALVEMFRHQRNSGSKRGIGYIPFMFCLLNYSAFVGFVKWISKDYQNVWKKAYA